MSRVWFVEPGYMEWRICCRFEVDGETQQRSVIVPYSSHRRAENKNAHLGDAIGYLSHHVDIIRAEGFLDDQQR